MAAVRPLPPLRVAYVQQNIPYRYDCGFESRLRVTRKCPEPGIIPETVHILFRLTNISFELIDMRNRSYKEAIDHVISGHVDMALQSVGFLSTGYPQLTDAYPTAGWTMPLKALSTAYARKDPYYQAITFTLVYNNWVWLAFIATFFTFKLYTKCLTRMFGAATFRNSYTQAFTVILTSFFVLLFSGLYKSGLLSHLLLSKHNHQFDTFDELLQLIEANRVRVLLADGMPELIERSQIHQLRSLNQALIDNPPIIVGSFADYELHKQQIVDGDAVLITGDLVSNVLARCGARQVTLLDDFAYEEKLFFNVNMSKTILERFNRAIIESMDASQMITDRYIESIDRSFKNCSEPLPSFEFLGGSLKITNIFGMILFLCTGLILGLIVVLCEVCYDKFVNFFQTSK